MPPVNTPPNPLDACNPAVNATVSASAGSGKTWLLITRIIRLLMDDAEPGNIIALTFTRKAAGEMQIRLNQRLYEMATSDDDKLDALLQLIGCECNTSTRMTAASLYEKLMHSLYPIRIQTFHSFCQDILSRFSLEADIPPGFELLEDTSLLERQAWQVLFDNARLPAHAKLNQQLDFIMQVCNGPDNTRTALQNFLSHRSDWWAYTAHQQDPVNFAINELTTFLQIEALTAENHSPVQLFLNDINKQKLTVFANFLREIKTKTSERHASSIDLALTPDADQATAFELIKSAFIKKDGEILEQGRKLTDALIKKLGNAHAEHFIKLHLEIGSTIQNSCEQLKRLLTLKINKAWYVSGHHYINIYQRLKNEMRLLDFTDLEWKCYQLLQHSDNAQWVQYKIDQRMDHLLIDEFQDTNPTQWHLLSPILEEIAANPEQRPRSVFLVGDEKQSIYSFRRANPALQAQASQWLAEHLQAKATPLDFSRRSSPAIIDCVNRVFEQDSVKTIMTGFTRHDTYLSLLPGRVQLCDLFEDNEQDSADNDAVYFRNPLTQARETSTKTLRHKEADFIARQILQITRQATPITDNGNIRAANFADILILMRNRTHIDIYENSLKQHGIPFIGNKKGGLLENLEIQDLHCLLNTLVTPFNNLALSQILKSPLFNASDEDLLLLASQNQATHWYERLLHLALPAETDDTASQPILSKALQRAATLLPRWQQLAEQLPIHDCLDKIFSEGDIINRYVAANKAENKQKVTANCQRFLELSLETDSGRYPSISRFLQRLNHLKNHSSTPPEEPLSQSNETRVSLMTIHGSKGLEAPIVFLADCNSTANNRNAYSSLVRWPADKSQPVNFQLQLNKDNTDQVTRNLQQEKSGEQAREELNLLYVALTRAREQLYISGIASSRSQPNSWYHIISKGLESDTSVTAADGTLCKIIQHLEYDQTSIKLPEKVKTNKDFHYEIDERLTSPIKDSHSPAFMIAPSLLISAHSIAPMHPVANKPDVTDLNVHELAKWRGTTIHLALEQLCKSRSYPPLKTHIENILHSLQNKTRLDNPAYLSEVIACMDEAVNTYTSSKLRHLFNPDESCQVYNEMPVMYQHGQQAVYGIIDRLVKDTDEIQIIDYKSHQLTCAETRPDAAVQFSEQLTYYREGIKKLWPGHKVKAGVLFTQQNKIYWLDGD